MKVLIHALGADMGGAVRHLTHFLPALANLKSELSPPPQYIILLRNKLRTHTKATHIKFFYLPNSVGSFFLLRLLFDNIFLPLYLKLKRIETVITLTNSGPLWGIKNHILFQRNALYFSQWYYQQLSFKDKIPYLTRKYYSYLLIKTSKMTLVPTQAMKESIIQTFPSLAPDIFTVFPHALELKQNEANSIPKNLIDLFPKKTITFLYPSHLAPYKGCDILLRALGSLKRVHRVQFQCLLTSSLQEWPKGKELILNLIQQEQLQDEVKLVGSVSHSVMAYLYKNSDVVVFPSLVESFGFPLAEALSFEKPVVAANTAVNREICQGGALYYSPLNSEAMAQQLKSVFAPLTRTKLIQEGKAQFASRDWSWETYVRQFERLI